MRHYRDWSSPESKFSTVASIGWLYSLQEAVYVDPQSGRRRLTAAFILHAENPDNWSFKKEALEIFPEFVELGANVRGINAPESPA